MRVYDGRPFRLAEHLARLQGSAERIGLERPDAGEFESLAALALEFRLPTMHNLRQFAEAGVLMSYGADFADLHKRSAQFVDKILKGAKPAELPVEQPTAFELVINLRTAKALGVDIPAPMLARANEVIE